MYLLTSSNTLFQVQVTLFVPVDLLCSRRRSIHRGTHFKTTLTIDKDTTT